MSVSVSPVRRPGASPDPTPKADGGLLACVRGVSLRLGGTCVLRDVDLDVHSGEVVVLAGPNGAGKSSLLAVLAGDQRAAGDVQVGGRPVHTWKARDAARARSVLLQDVAITFPFTAHEVVRMGRAPWAGTRQCEEDDDVVAACMAQTEVCHLVDRLYSTLSGGEQARVALARVLAQQTPLVLLDEPTAALDLRHQELVLQVARQRAAAGDAVVVVLHDLSLAAAHADRIVLLHGGQVASDGAPKDVLHTDLLSEVYQHPVEVIAHPRTGTPIVLARRD